MTLQKKNNQHGREKTGLQEIHCIAAGNNTKHLKMQYKY